MSPETIELQTVMQGYFHWHKARVTFISAFILSLIKLRSGLDPFWWVPYE